MTDDLGKLIELPSGMRLFYRDEDHSYWRCKDNGERGMRLTGVTTAIKPIDFEADRLLNWAARTQCLGIAELAAPILMEGPTVDVKRLAWLSSQDGIWEELEAHELTFTDVRDRAGTVGTNVHELALGKLARGEPVPSYDEMTEEEQGYAQGVVAFWLDHEPEPEQVEQVVADEGLGIAGRFDLRAGLRPCRRPGCPCAKGPRINRQRRLRGLSPLPTMVDAKTGKWIFPKDHVQLPGYDHLSQLSGIGRSWPLLILHLRPDGSYELIEAKGRRGDFTRAAEMYRRRARIERAARRAQQKREELST